MTEVFGDATFLPHSVPKECDSNPGGGLDYTSHLGRPKLRMRN